MMTGTLTLPCNMIEAAYSYADRESLSIVDFFAKLLNQQYGYVVTMSAERSVKASAGLMAVSPRVRALRGVAKTADNRHPQADVRRTEERGREFEV